MKLGEVKPKVGRERVDLEDVLGMLKLPKGKWVTVRLLPSDVLPVRRHWINILAGKDKREVKIPKICVSFDPMSESDKKGVHCPYCDLAGGAETFYLANVIVRSEQENAPAKARVTKGERESGFKDPNSESWTPVQVMRITSSLAKKIQGLKDLNKVKSKKTQKTSTYDISDERFGCDINVKYDGDAKGPDKYQVQMGERSPLTEEEAAYLQWELHDGILDEIGRESEKDATSELKRMEIVGEDELPEDDDEDEMSLGRKKSSKKPPAKGKSKRSSRDEDDDEDDEDGDDDAPPPRKKPAPKGKRRPADEDEDDEDEDEDEDDGDEDEEDDDPPARKKKPAPKSKKPAPKSKRSSRDEDDDEDDEDGDDEDDEDDEDDDPPARKKKPAPKGKRRPADDDEDDEDEDSEDEEDDDPPPRKKKPVAKGKTSKRRPSDDDDDDDIPF